MRVPRRAGPVEDEAEGERGLRVFPLADRIRELRQPVGETGRGCPFERRQGCRPGAGFGVVPPPELGGELQQPREAVGPFERRAACSFEIGDLPRHLLRREGRAESGSRGRDEPGGRVAAREPREKPVAVDRGMPVVAPEENRGQEARGPRVRVAFQRVRDLVRVFPGHAREREIREALRGGLVEGRGGRRWPRSREEDESQSEHDARMLTPLRYPLFACGSETQREALPRPPDSPSSRRSFSAASATVVRRRSRPATSFPLPRRESNSERRGPESLTWLGHASFLLRTGGMTILTDPFLSERASPFRGLRPETLRPARPADRGPPADRRDRDLSQPLRSSG